jgi:hypothetical protein
MLDATLIMAVDNFCNSAANLFKALTVTVESINEGSFAIVRSTIDHETVLFEPIIREPCDHDHSEDYGH